MRVGGSNPIGVLTLVEELHIACICMWSQNLSINDFLSILIIFRLVDHHHASMVARLCHFRFAMRWRQCDKNRPQRQRNKINKSSMSRCRVGGLLLSRWRPTFVAMSLCLIVTFSCFFFYLNSFKLKFSYINVIWYIIKKVHDVHISTISSCI